MPKAPIGLFLLSVGTLVFGGGSSAGAGYIIGKLVGVSLPKSREPIPVEVRKLVPLSKPHQDALVLYTRDDEDEYVYCYAWRDKHGVCRQRSVKVDLERIDFKFSDGKHPRLSITRVGFAHRFYALVGIASSRPRYVFYVPLRCCKNAMKPLQQLG